VGEEKHGKERALRGRIGVLGLRGFLVLLACMVASAAFLVAANSESQGQPASPRDEEAREAARDRDRGRGKERAVLVIHGGTNSLERGELTPEEEAELRAALEAALQAGKEVLDSGGSSMDAVEASIKVMEDDPMFNAGKGAVFNADGEHELDASIMDGSDLSAGAVAGIQNVKNPISAARLVKDESPHVLLSGEGADDFVAANGLETVSQDYFFTCAQWEDLVEDKQDEGKESGETCESDNPAADDPLGTVGAVALDQNGNLAAGTSTGGRDNKFVGRIGDSPIVGAGNYANNDTVAVSGTGTGEFFIRTSAAYDVSALMRYRKFPVERAADTVLGKILDVAGSTRSSNGIIALDKRGNFATVFSRSMDRGYVTRDGRIVTEIYPDE